MNLLNLGILAHVDAGKTSLTERLLLAAGVIDQLGRVDHGTTQTDSLVLERQRGITIRSAVTSFVLDDDTVVNLIDTPGHPDFIAEVERVLAVLDGVVLVVSAVEGVQAQTRVLMRALRRLGLPTVIFVNKIDRVGARTDALLPVLTDHLGVSVLPMTSVAAAGGPDARVVPYPAEVFAQLALDRLTAKDDELLASYLTDPDRLTPARVWAELGRQTRGQQTFPVYFGSALTGAGTDELMAGLGKLLPTEARSGDAPASGTVFKVERGAAGERIAYVRMFTGTLRTRDRRQFGPGGAEKITQIRVFDRGAARPADALSAGQIGQLWGLRTVRVGDSTGAAPIGVTPEFAPPSLESVVVAAHADDQGALFLALTQLAEQDPLIDLRQDEGRGELSVSLYGEVQKEVLAATLAADYGLTVNFRPTTTRCIERLVGPGAAVEHIATPPNPFLATVGLRLEPALAGSGVSFELEIELGSMPLAFFRAIEEAARRELSAGLSGWPVPDCVVTVTHGKYWPRQSHAHATFDKAMSSTGRDFRHLTPLVVVDALRRAGTRVHEPIHYFELEVPDDVVAAVLPAVARAEGVALDQVPAGSATRITGTVPAARVQQLRQELPPLTRGEGLLDTTFGHFAPVRGAAPTRPRPEPDATHRKSYLLQVERRVSGSVDP